MPVYLPCLNPDKPDSGGGFSVGVTAAYAGGDVNAAGVGVSVTHSDSPVTLSIVPVPPFIFFGPNFQFWSSLFGLGDTRIDREKQQIQDILTSIFRYLRDSYGVPIRDGHALQFGSDGVRAQLLRRPDIAALVPSLMVTAPIVSSLVFADKDPSQGQQERTVNQFLANAAINDWPVGATVQIWEGIVDAANPACSEDASRWLKDPYTAYEIARLAVLLQYVPLHVMAAYAARYAVGSALGNSLVTLWANNPSLVTDIPLIRDQPWQSRYDKFEGSGYLWPSEFGEWDRLMTHPELAEILRGVWVNSPHYPDFALPPQGGVQNPYPPRPQPPPTPQPQPQPTPTPTPQPTPEPTPQPTPQPQPQPTPTPTPQPTPAPPNQTLEIPSQQDYDRGCQISRKMATRQPLSQADLDWMLTNIGAQAITWAVNSPDCGRPSTTQPGNFPDPTQPDCPPFPTQPDPTVPGNQVPNTPLPNPFPDPTLPRQPQPCPPLCQDQLDQLRQDQRECCRKVDWVILPRLDNLDLWIADLERRVPGPMPIVPNPPFIPPSLPPGELPDPTEPEPEPAPGEPVPPSFTPACKEILEDLCDAEKRCELFRECERELECVRLPLCDPQGGPWGGMTECWHRANETPQRDVYGIYRQAQLPQSFNALYLRSYQQGFRIQGQWSGPSQSETYTPANPARWDALSDKLAKQFVSDWRANTVTQQRESVTIPSRPWIFADPAGEPLGQIKIRQPKLRAGEADPCAAEPPQVLEIPPASPE